MALGCTVCASIDYPVAPVWMECGHEPPVANPRTRYEPLSVGYERDIVERLDRLLNVLEGEHKPSVSEQQFEWAKISSALRSRRTPDDTVCACGRTKKAQYAECYQCANN